jgi:hemerythrin-like domain-containing protein
MTSTQLLMAEHGLILQALQILDEILIEIEQGKEINEADVRSLLAFLRDFAGGLHHVKEEAIFFPALMQAGIGCEDGPMALIGYEHERVRMLAAAMSEALERRDFDGFLTSAYRYAELLTEHIAKENDVLFNIADGALSDEEHEEVAEAFRNFEESVVGRQAMQEFQAAVETLASKYLHAIA